MREVKRVLRRLFRQAPATFTLCAANVVVYLLTAVQSLSFLHNLDESSLAQHWVLYLPNMVDSIAGPLRAVGATFHRDDLLAGQGSGKENRPRAIFHSLFCWGCVRLGAIGVVGSAACGSGRVGKCLCADGGVRWAGSETAGEYRPPGSHYIDPGQPRFQRAQPGSLAGRARWWIDSGDCDGGGAHHRQNHAHALGWCAGRVWFGSGGVDDTRY